MQQSGELERFLNEFNQCESDFKTNEIKMIDQLDSILLSIRKAENEIYESLKEQDARIVCHDEQDNLMNMLTPWTNDDPTLGNL